MDRAIRVYEAADGGALVQQHHGHSDAVRCIVHVAEKQQYITASWDHTIRVWKAYAGPGKGGGAGAVRGGAVAAAGAAPNGLSGEDAEAGDGGGAEEEPRELTYAERFPLREPRFLSKPGGQTQFLKKASNEETRERKKKKQAKWRTLILTLTLNPDPDPGPEPDRAPDREPSPEPSPDPNRDPSSDPDPDPALIRRRTRWPLSRSTG